MKIFRLLVIGVLAAVVAGPARVADGQAMSNSTSSLTIIYNAGTTTGSYPKSPLTLGSDGNLYGLTDQGGDNGGYGTVFVITPSGVLTTLHSFANSDGASPRGGLVQGSCDGYFYGTTETGGTSGWGTVFKTTSAGTLTTLADFNYNDGAYPVAKLLQVGSCCFLGTCSTGGVYGCGDVFEICSNGPVSVLYYFGGSTNDDGCTPRAGLVTGCTTGCYYGTTEYGGTYGQGTIYQICLNGTSAVETVLYSFTGGSDGASPEAALVPFGGGSNGNDCCYLGTTAYGGTCSNWGTVYEFCPGITNVPDTLFPLCDDHFGGDPVAELVLDNGAYYVTTAFGGDSNNGAVLQVTPNYPSFTLSTVHSFTGGSDGGYPVAALCPDTNGNLWGTTALGGSNNNGTVFELSSIGRFSAGTFSSAYSFGSGAYGAGMVAGLIQASDGSLYIDTPWGATYNWGAITRIDPTTGILSNLHMFTGGGDGGAPAGPLTQGCDGKLYGTTEYGGTLSNCTYKSLPIGCGTIFCMSTNGVFTNLWSFGGGSGPENPVGGLVAGCDCCLYGTTAYGGSNDWGTIFQFCSNGPPVVLHTFTDGSNDGGDPVSSLVKGCNCCLYGVTPWGGAHNWGGVFQICSGQFTWLYSFTDGVNDGGAPRGRLAFGSSLVSESNCCLYGTTTYGGSNNWGTAFSICPNGTNAVFTLLHSFTDHIDGGNPRGGPVVGSDGNLYVLTANGGASTFCDYGCGALVSINPVSGLTSNLFSFNGSNGSYPVASPVQDVAGNFWIPTEYGGNSGFGVIGRLTVPLSHTPNQVSSLQYQGSDSTVTVSLTIPSVAGNSYLLQINTNALGLLSPGMWGTQNICNNVPMIGYGGTLTWTTLPISTVNLSNLFLRFQITPGSL